MEKPWGGQLGYVLRVIYQHLILLFYHRAPQSFCSSLQAGVSATLFFFLCNPQQIAVVFLFSIISALRTTHVTAQIAVGFHWDCLPCEK